MKKLLKFALFISLIGSLTACSSATPKEGDKSTTTTPSTTETTEKAATGEKSKITFMDSMPNPERTAAFNRYITDFNTANENSIEVVYESVPWDDAHNKLVSLAAAKSLPDVIQLHATWYSEFISAGWVVPITENYNALEFKDSFAPLVDTFLMQKQQIEPYKEIYAIPEGTSVNGVFVRSDWMKEIGVSYDENWTWDDFFDLAEKLTDPAKNRYGLAYRGARAGMDQINWYILSETQGQRFTADGTSTLLEPKSLEAFIRYTDVYKKGFAPADSINWGYPEMVQGFMTGLTGMLVQTTEVVQVAEQSLEPDQWEVLPIPKSRVDGKYYVGVGSSVNNAISVNTKDKDASWEFIKHLTSPEVNIDLCKNNYLIPLVKEAENDEFYKGNMQGYVALVNSPDLAITGDDGYFPELGEYRENYMDSEVQKYLLDKQTAEQTVDNLGNRLTEYQQKFMKENPDMPIPEPFFVK